MRPEFLDEFDITAVIGTSRKLAAMALNREVHEIAIAARVAQLDNRAQMLQSEFQRLVQHAMTLGPEYRRDWTVGGKDNVLCAIAGDAWARCVAAQVDIYLSWSNGRVKFERAAELKQDSCTLNTVAICVFAPPP